MQETGAQRESAVNKRLPLANVAGGGFFDGERHGVVIAVQAV